MISKLEKFAKRNRQRNKHLYAKGLKEGDDYIVCPVSKARLSMIKSTHIERNLGMTVADFEKLYPSCQKNCNKRGKNISDGLLKLDASGVSIHAKTVAKATKTRAKIGEDGLSINDRKGRKTRATHMANIDENGLNGYQRIAKVSRPKQIKTMAKNNRAIPTNQRSEWQQYSIFHGYLNKISPTHVCSVENLRVISWEKKIKKNRQSSISIGELMYCNNATLEISNREFDYFVELTKKNTNGSSLFLYEELRNARICK